MMDDSDPTKYNKQFRYMSLSSYRFLLYITNLSVNRITERVGNSANLLAAYYGLKKIERICFTDTVSGLGLAEGQETRFTIQIN